VSIYAERASGHDCNVRVLKQVLAKVEIVLQNFALRRSPAEQSFAGRKEIERTLRTSAAKAVDRVELGQRSVTPALKSVIAFGDEIHRTVQCDLGGSLRDRAGIAGAL
jgi:hypothetical protein